MDVSDAKDGATCLFSGIFGGSSGSFRGTGNKGASGNYHVYSVKGTIFTL
jgi:hypothetical protein